MLGLGLLLNVTRRMVAAALCRGARLIGPQTKSGLSIRTPVPNLRRASAAWSAPFFHDAPARRLYLNNPSEIARLGISRLPCSALKFRASHRDITKLMTSTRFGEEFTRRRPIKRRNVIRTRQEDDELVPVNLDDRAPRQWSQRQPFPILLYESPLLPTSNARCDVRCCEYDSMLVPPLASERPCPFACEQRL
jgi:hypothetical protein